MGTVKGVFDIPGDLDAYFYKHFIFVGTFMKAALILSIFMLFFVGCATSYTPIVKLESIGDAEENNGELRAIVGIQKYKLVINYSDATGNKKELRIPYKL